MMNRIIGRSTNRDFVISDYKKGFLLVWQGVVESQFFKKASDELIASISITLRALRVQHNAPLMPVQHRYLGNVGEQQTLELSKFSAVDFDR